MGDTGLKTQIDSLNKTVEIQQKTLEAMEKRVLETEKIGNVYRHLFEELLTEAEKWKVAVLKFKDERISLLEQANQNSKQPNTTKIEFEKMVEALNALELRVSTVNQLSAYSEPALKDWVDKGSSLETMMKNERTVESRMSAYPEEGRKLALAIWRFLDADSEPRTMKTIASKLNLDVHIVNTAINQLVEMGCVASFQVMEKPATYTSILPSS